MGSRASLWEFDGLGIESRSGRCFLFWIFHCRLEIYQFVFSDWS